MKWAARLFRRSVRQALPVSRPRLRVESLELREVPASIAGNVFRDFNNNGASNAPDAPIAGVTVRVTGGALTAPVTVTTNATGNFIVPSLAAGTYTLTAVAPTGTAAGKSTAGTALGTAGSTNTVTGITLTADQAATGYTFGEVPNALSSGGKVFNDANGNGTQDTGEKGIAGVTVTLTGTSALTGSAITARTAATKADGSYLFTGLTSGSYNVAETPKAGFVRGTLKNGTPAAASTANGSFTGIDLTASAAASTGYAFADVKAPVLTLTQSVNTPRAKAGEQVTITYTAKNPGAQAINNVAASVNLDGLTFVSSAGTGFDSTTKEWTVGTLAAGASATMSITATVPSGAVFLPASRLVSTDTAAGVTGDTAFSRVNAGPSAVTLQSFLSSTYRTQAVGVGGTPTFPAAPTGSTPTTPTAPTVNFFNAAGTTALTGNSTAETTATIKGTTSATTAVTIVETGATTTSDGGGAYTFSAVPVVVGTNQFTVKAGTGTNTSQTVGTVTRTTTDTTIPTPPVLSLFNAAGTTALVNGATTDATAVIKGTTTANTPVAIVQTGATATSDGAGAFTFSGVPLTTGANTLTVKAGTGTNVSQAIATITRSGATTPTTPVLSLFNAAGTTALVNGATTEATATVKGTTSANTAVTIVETGATATSDASGAFTFSAVPLTVGTNTLTVKAGTGTNTSQAVATITRTSATAPTTPVLSLFNAAGTTALVNGATTETTATIKGTTSANTAVTIVETGATATSDVAGAFTFSAVPLTVGANTLTVKAGTGTNTSQAVATITRGSATPTTPTAPTVTFFNAAGTTALTGGSTAEATTVIKGTTTASTPVTITQTGAIATSDASGAYTFSAVPLTTGANPFTVKAGTGTATSQTTASLTRTAAATAPTTPTVTFFKADTTTAVTGNSTNEGTVTIKGMTSANTAVTLVQTADTATSDASGAYEFNDVPVIVGANTFTVKAGTGAATSQATGTLTGTATAATPTAPTGNFFKADTTTAVTGNSTNEGTVTIKGTTTALATLTLKETGGTAVADNAGAFEFDDVPVVVGTNTYTIQATGDDATTRQTVKTLTGTATAATPAAPTVTFFNAAGDTALVGGTTAEVTVTIKGVTTANADVKIVETADMVTADASGAYEFAAVPVAVGANTFTVRAAGTDGTARQVAGTVTRADAAPATLPLSPTVTFFNAAGTTQLTSGTTTETTATVKGVTSAATPVTLVETGATTTSNGSGAYTFSAVPVPTGTSTFTVKAGVGTNTNQTAATLTRAAAAPATPTFLLYNAAGTTVLTNATTTDATGVIKGTTSANTAVTIVETGATATSDASGAFTVSALPLTVGSNTFTIQAGTGTSTSQAVATITRTGAGPTTPTVNFFNAAGTTAVTGGTTTETTAVIKGTTSATTPVTIVETGATTTSDGAGAFTFSAVPLTVGSNTFTVKAGTGANTSQATGSLTRTSASNTAPTIGSQQAAVALSSAATTQTIDLSGKFTDADLASTKLRFHTTLGDVNVDLFDKQAPRTVANFLNYVNDGDYTNSIFHRSVSNFVIQGGGFKFNGAGTPSITTVPADPAVQNEPDVVNRSNLRGTVAMAKLGGDPNSATDQFFFNLGNNAANLDAQNGGFTVFGKVSAAADQAVVDALAAIPTQNKSSTNSAFDSLPLRNYTGTAFPTDTTIANYAAITGAAIVSQPEVLSYTVVNNTNSAAVTATLVHDRLTVTRVAGQTGAATITVRATDKVGATVDMTFTVTAS